MSESDPELRLTVLVAEDETLVRLFAADFLDEAGFKVFEAVNADEAVTILKARPDVQVVVTDVEMPGSMDGFYLAKLIRERWPGIGVIITSGRNAPPADLPESIPVILKPYMPSTIIKLIRQMATPQVVDPASSVVQRG